LRRRGRQGWGITRASASFLIDFFLLAVVVHICALIDLYMNEQQNMNFAGAITWVGFGVMMVMFALLDVMLRASPGKRIMRLVIAHEDGREASRSALWKRTLIKHSPCIFVLFPVVMICIAQPYFGFREYVRDALMAMGVIDAVFTFFIALYVIAGCLAVRKAGHQAYHDRVAGTAVFRVSDLSSRRGFAPLVAQKVESISESAQGAEMAETR
jgi:uncharacterized RDD family membrane protein YckC